MPAIGPDFDFPPADWTAPAPDGSVVDPLAPPAELDLPADVLAAPAPITIDPIDPPGLSDAEGAARIRAAELDQLGGAWSPGAPPPWAVAAPATPTLPDPDPMPWDANDIEMEVELGMADSERFADEHDADPLARAAEQTFEDEQARQARVDAQADAYDRLDPIAFADMQAKRQLTLDHERATRELEAAELDRQQLEANVKRREQATAAADRELADVSARASAMADSSPFESWFSDRSAPQQFAGMVAAVFSGLLEPKGRNGAIDMFVQTAEADAAQKWKKLEVRRGLAQDARADASTDFREREAIRIASLEQVARGIDARIALLDPEGSQALKLSEVRRGVRARQAEALAAFKKEAFDRSDKMIKADQEQQRIDIERAKARADIAKKLGLAGGGAGGVGAGYGSKVTYEQAKANGWPIPAGLQPGQSVPAKQYKAFLDTEAKVGNISSSDATRADRELDHQLKLNAVTVTDPKTGGDLFQARTEKEAIEARTKVFAARQVVNYIDEILAIRDRVGGESSWGNSDDYQRLKVLASNIRLLKKQDTQGMSSDKDIEIIADAVGAASPASFRARAAGLKRARGAVMGQLNGYLRDAQGYQGQPIAFTNLFARKKAKPDPDVDALVSREAGGRVPVLKTEAGAGPTGPAGPLGPVGPAGPAGPGPGRTVIDDEATRAARAAETPEETARLDAELTTEQQTALDNLKGRVEKGDKAAAAKLAQVMRDGRTNRRASSAAMNTLVVLAAGGNQIAMRAMQRAVDPDAVIDDEDEGDEGGEE